MAQFTISWNAYKQNICSGLSSLQQNGEFVDMTLAADGHHVKVHQLVMCLVSPYIKELITSASCSHPVIFLNKMSYATLCAILEYIYTGEVLVPKENLPDLVEAARELHIKGLEEMKVELSNDSISQAGLARNNPGQPLSQTGYFKAADIQTDEEAQITTSKISKKIKEVLEEVEDNNEYKVEEDNTYADAMDTDHGDVDYTINTTTSPQADKLPDARLQYTISNQGMLQLILNRCVYSLRYTSRRGPKEGHRQWRCIYYSSRHAFKCPATVITKDNVVVKRFSAHNHPFHDKQIMKKVLDNAVYSAIRDAEAFSESRKQERQMKSSTRKPVVTDTK